VNRSQGEVCHFGGAGAQKVASVTNIEDCLRGGRMQTEKTAESEKCREKVGEGLHKVKENQTAGPANAKTSEGGLIRGS